MRPRVIYFGTPDIAVPALRALVEVADVTAVVCQPDKPVGRDPAPQAPPTKRAAIELGIPVHQPTKVKTPDFAAWVREQRADAGVVLAYGRILTAEVLATPARGCINLHASLLPKLRGAAPIQWAIVRGEAETGITLMQMDAGIDTGPMLAKRTLAIGPDETGEALAARMGELAAEMVRAEVLDAIAGRLSPTPQDDAASTLAPILTKEHGIVDWRRPAHELHDLARGLHPWPGAHTTHRGKSFKLIETRVAPAATSPAEPGTVITAPKGQLWVACGVGALSITRGQAEGRKVLPANELLGGRVVAVGDRFGTLSRGRRRATLSG